MKESIRLVQVVTALSDRREAAELAEEVVGARLAACVQVSGPVTSVYRWEGCVRKDEEWVLTMKTPPERAADLMRFVDGHHSYDTPEILVTEVDVTSPDYARWAEDST